MLSPAPSPRQTPAAPMIHVTCGGQTAAFPQGTTVKEALDQLYVDESGPGLLCALRGGECLELDAKLTQDAELRGLDYRDEEGRRVYERSLRFLLLLSMKRLFPEKRIRILNSVGYGVYLRVLGEDMDHAMVHALERDMRQLVAEDVSFLRETWTREEAIAYFAGNNYPDKAEILAYRPGDTIPMYGMEDMREFVRVNEALHDKSIGCIADEIVQRNAQIVLVFGPSSSGKTTFAHRLAVHLRVLGKRPQLVSLDDFYRPRDHVPLDSEGKPDLEHVDALD
ncbi:MAG: hypothetical protein EOM58_12870, partial [Clostridia bacterium]|nr:hypothetical protein [Clostridia bacterium]